MEFLYEARVRIRLLAPTDAAARERLTRILARGCHPSIDQTTLPCADGGEGGPDCCTHGMLIEQISSLGPVPD